MNILETVIASPFHGFAFINLVDFDMKYGHRRDYKGYVKALEIFDLQLSKLIGLLNHDDLLILTADHGNDPTHTGSDHTREYVPVLFYSNSLKQMRELKLFDTFADIGATVADIFDVEKLLVGESILNKLLQLDFK